MLQNFQESVFLVLVWYGRKAKRWAIFLGNCCNWWSPDGWIPACWLEVVNELLIFLCLCTRLLGYLINSTLNFSHFYPSDFLPHTTVGKVSKWLRGAELSTGFKPQTLVIHPLLTDWFLPSLSLLKIFLC